MKIEFRDFRPLSKSDNWDITLSVEEEGGCQLQWIRCTNLFLSDGVKRGGGEGAIWSYTDIEAYDGRVQAFNIPIIGFAFDFWSGFQHWTAYVHPHPGPFKRLHMLPVGGEKAPEPGTQIDDALTALLAGRKLHIRVAARTKGDEEE